ncbi:hypothetical protein D9M70_388210 [compost metagenome]
MSLDHRDLDAELAVGDTQFQADVTATDHQQAARQAARRQGFGGGDHLAAQRQAGQFHRLRAGRQQQVFAMDALVAAADQLDVHRLAVGDLRPALHHLHPVLLQQGGDAAGELVDDAVLPFDGAGDVDLRRLHPDAQGRMRRIFAGLEELLGGVDQRLRGDAADIQAGAAEGGAFHQHGGDAQLARADSGDVATGAAADDQQGGFQGRVHAHSRNSVAGCSSRPRTAWMKAAASMPSTTR